MSLPSRTKILPDQIPVSPEALDAFSGQFREIAREQGLTVTQAGRYEAWVLAFLTWCREATSRRAETDRIEAFRTALCERSTVGEAAVREAMDALAFLLGTARGATAHLAAEGVEAESERKGAEDVQASVSEKEVFTLQACWDEKNQSEGTAGAAGRSSRDRTEEAEASTAELCIEHFQTQLDTLHAGTSQSEDVVEETGRQ